MQPGLAALLRHHPVRAPRGVFVIETFVSRPNGLLVRKGHAGLVEAGQIGQPIVACRRHYPRITAIGKAGSEAVVVFKNQRRLDAHVRQRCAPTDRWIIQVHVELSEHGLTLKGHVRRRREVGFLDVLQVAHQRLLRRAAGAGIPLDCPLIDHDRESEAGMSFGLRHDLERGLIDGITRTVPIENHAIDSAADHVIDLILDLRRTGRVVADIHMARLPEPENHVGIDFGCRTRIEQRVHIDLADVSGSQVAIRQSAEAVGRTGVVGSLGGERGGWNYIRRTGCECIGNSQEQNCYCEICLTHWSSGADKTEELTKFLS